MKTCNAKFASGILAVAVQSALVAMFSMPTAAFSQTAASPAPADDEVTALTKPTNFIELGIGNVSESSAKFGEYNGLNKSGGYGVGNFNIRGGDAYDGGDGIRRWGLTGTDIGTTSREMGASIADQGLWSANVRFDDLYHAITDTFNTPYVGVQGGNTFTLPSNFGPINTSAPPATAKNSTTQLVGTRNFSPAQAADFDSNNVDVGVTRKNSSFGTTYNYDRKWSVQFDYNHLSETGSKILSVASDGSQSPTVSKQWAAVATNAFARQTGPWAGEAAVSLLNPYEYQTETFNLAVNYVGEEAYFTIGYFGSYFHDDNDSLNWDSPYVKGSTKNPNTTAPGVFLSIPTGLQFPQDLMSTAPSSLFNQFNFKGGYTLAPTTKLVGGLSYGRTTQDDAYQVESFLMQPGGLPQSSLQGSIITKNVNLKLTDSTFKGWSLAAGVKYNERENNTPSNVYQWNDIDAPPDLRINANPNYSNSKTESELDASYKLTNSQKISFTYSNEIIERWCNNLAAVNPSSPNMGGSSPAGATCVITPRSDENRFTLGYRYKVSGDLNANLSYSYAKRNTTVDNNAITPLYDAGGATAPGAITAVNGYSKDVNGAGFVNASNYPGFMSYFDASRTQNTIKAGLNWQPDDALTLSTSARYNKDDYFDSTLGETGGHSASFNLDASYAYAENGAFAIYGTVQQRQINALSGTASNGNPNGTGSITTGIDTSNNLSGNAAGLVDPANTYSTQLNDKDFTFGLNLNQKGMLDGKLELMADASLSLGRTGYSVGTPYYIPATATGSTATILANIATCASPGELICGSTPDITNRTLQFRLNAHYSVDKHNKLAVRYMYQKESVTDYYYNGLQYGYTPSTVMPTNQMAPNYSVNVIAVSYIHTF